MTRKRFIKLMMARGSGRNNAQFEALLVRAAGKSYAEVYRRMRIVWDIQDGMNRMLEKIALTGQSMYESAHSAWDDFVRRAFFMSGEDHHERDRSRDTVDRIYLTFRYNPEELVKSEPAQQQISMRGEADPE